MQGRADRPLPALHGDRSKTTKGKGRLGVGQEKWWRGGGGIHVIPCHSGLKASIFRSDLNLPSGASAALSLDRFWGDIHPEKAARTGEERG